jgi:hypothetical protein
LFTLVIRYHADNLRLALLAVARMAEARQLAAPAFEPRVVRVATTLLQLTLRWRSISSFDLDGRPDEHVLMPPTQIGRGVGSRLVLAAARLQLRSASALTREHDRGWFDRIIL